jgi:hypothetical protein
MRKLILFLFICSFSYSQKPQNIEGVLFGTWINGDREVLIIQPNQTFVRRTATEILAVGKLQKINNELRVIRTDVEDEYNLLYYIGKENFVIAKPRSQQAWLFTRIGN